MEGNSDWCKSETNGSVESKLNELLTEFDGDNNVALEFSIKEEMVAKVMQELYKEISPSTCTKPTTCPASFPSLSLSSSLSSSSLWTPLANTDSMSESCEASVSDLASTVMAGIEYMGSPAKMGSPENAVWMAEGVGCSCKVAVRENFGETPNDSDGGELTDEWLRRLLKWDPLQLDDHCSSR